MPNILINTNCNRSCPYCFASSELNAKTDNSMFMSLETVGATIDYLKKSGEKRFSIIGGEPTLHPDFARIIQMILDAGMSINIFTNGVMRKETADMLAEIPEEKISLLANINELQSYSESETDKLMYAMKTLSRKCSVGFNIHNLDFDFTFLADIVNEFDMRRVVRLGISAPIYQGENIFIPTSDFKTLGSKIVEQAAICDMKDVMVGFDCGFTMCMFTDQQLGKLLQCGAKLDFHCQPVIDIGLDHQVWTCFPLSNWKKVKLSDYGSVSEMVDYYNREMMLYHISGVHNECHKCKHLRRKTCAGGCVSRVLHSFENSKGDN